MCIDSELDSVPEPNIFVHLSDKKKRELSANILNSRCDFCQPQCFRKHTRVMSKYDKKSARANIAQLTLKTSERKKKANDEKGNRQVEKKTQENYRIRRKEMRCARVTAAQSCRTMHKNPWEKQLLHFWLKLNH